MRCIRVSSSIENFKTKLEKKYADYETWKWTRAYSKTIFFGTYHWADYVRLLIHRGPRTVVWCGGDILNLRKSWWLPLIVNIKAIHYCENEVEALSLRRLGIDPIIKPLYFDDIDGVGITYLSSKLPQVYLTAHPGREEEYGVYLVEKIAHKVDVLFHIFGVDGESHDNIIYHGEVETRYFDEMIKHYQGALRLNAFDGFSETLAKSLLMGQYPISRIDYPFVSTFTDEKSLIDELNMLQFNKEPNFTGATYYRDILCKRLEV